MASFWLLVIVSCCSRRGLQAALLLVSAMLCVDRFIVPEDKLEEFEATWHEREDFMQQMPGFLGFSIERKTDSEFVVTSK